MKKKNSPLTRSNSNLFKDPSESVKRSKLDPNVSPSAKAILESKSFFFTSFFLLTLHLAFKNNPEIQAQVISSLSPSQQTVIFFTSFTRLYSIFFTAFVIFNPQHITNKRRFSST